MSFFKKVIKVEKSEKWWKMWKKWKMMKKVKKWHFLKSRSTDNMRQSNLSSTWGGGRPYAGVGTTVRTRRCMVLIRGKNDSEMGGVGRYLWKGGSKRGVTGRGGIKLGQNDKKVIFWKNDEKMKKWWKMKKMKKLKNDKN